MQVLSLSLSGNHKISTHDIEAGLATHANGRFPWSPKAYFDRNAFEADLVRIRRLYQDRGYPNMHFARVDVAMNDAKDGVRISIAIEEGDPVILESAKVTGIDALNARLEQSIARMPPPVGQPRDRTAVSASRQNILNALYDRGYAYASVRADEQPGSSADRVALDFVVAPGPRVVFGPIAFVGLKNVTPDVVQRELSFKTGELYSRRLVTESQRRLTGLQILQFVDINAQPPQGPPLAAIPVTVTVAESPPRQVQLGIGYGSEERVRGSAQWSHLNFFGGARQATATAQWSSIDRGIKLDLLQPYLGVRGLSLDVSATTWWTNELTYSSHRYGGRVGLVYRLNRGRRRAARAPQDTFRVTYVHEYLRYTVTPEALADPNAFDQLIALGLNPVTGGGLGTEGSIAFDAEHRAVDNVADPHRGYGASVHLEDARPALGGTFRYTESILNGEAYVPVGSSLVVAGRVRYGVIAAPDDASVPFSERFFLGGSTSLRGWGRYEVAPLLDGLPIGGRAMFETSGELRMPVTASMGAVLFVDAGNAWPDASFISLDDLRRDAGFGLRYRTPVGLLRGDLGFQLGSIPGLVVNGKPETRHWRVHVSIGQAF